MGRPINHRYIGTDTSHTVLTPTIKIPGSASGAGFIIKQVATNRYLCALQSDTTNQGVCTLVDTITGDNQMQLSFTGQGGGHVSHLTNHTLRDFADHTYQWGFDASPPDGTVYLSSNSIPG